jgi:pimeloyl-ACP methyl ester carboxylesterase
VTVAVRLATHSWGDGVTLGDGSGSGEASGSGADRPLALLIHGVTSSSMTWWRVAPELVRRGYRVLAVDLRGHGASPRVSEGLVLGDLSADVLETLQADRQKTPAATDGQRPADAAGAAGAAGAVAAHDPDAMDRDRAGTDRDLGVGAWGTGPGAGGAAIDLVVGHSLGALVALDLLAKVPGLARRLVLEEPAGPTGIDWETMAEGIENDGRRARAEPEGLRRELAGSNPELDPAEVDRRLGDMAACDTDGVAAALRRTTSFDLVGLASAVRIPTLLVVGLEDLGSALVGPDRLALVDALAGHSVFEVLDDGHNLHREAFPRFMDVLDRWLGATARVREG